MYFKSGSIYLGLLGVHIDMCPIVSAVLFPRGAQPRLGWTGWVGSHIGGVVLSRAWVVEGGVGFWFM